MDQDKSTFGPDEESSLTSLLHSQKPKSSTEIMCCVSEIEVCRVVCSGGLPLAKEGGRFYCLTE